MEFNLLYIYAAITTASVFDNTEIVRELLAQKGIDISIKNVLFF